jgi:hypothetical protein
MWGSIKKYNKIVIWLLARSYSFLITQFNLSVKALLSWVLSQALEVEVKISLYY